MRTRLGRAASNRELQIGTFVAGVVITAAGIFTTAHALTVDHVGRKSCQEYADRYGGPGAKWTGLVMPNVKNGTYSDGTIRVTISGLAPGGPSFNWSANMGVDAVFVDAGPRKARENRLYVYNPEVSSGTGLTGADGTSEVDHVMVCYDVTPPATTTTTGATTTTPTTAAQTTTTALTTTTNSIVGTVTTLAATTTVTVLGTTVVGGSTTPTTVISTLPRTGAADDLLALGGILAIITGIGLVIVSRRNTLAELAN